MTPNWTNLSCYKKRIGTEIPGMDKVCTSNLKLTKIHSYISSSKFAIFGNMSTVNRCQIHPDNLCSGILFRNFDRPGTYNISIAREQICRPEPEPKSKIWVGLELIGARIFPPSTDLITSCCPSSRAASGSSLRNGYELL